VYAAVIVIGLTMSSEKPQFLLVSTLADAVEDISLPVLAGATFVLCVLLHFIFGVLSKISGGAKGKKRRMKKKLSRYENN
jgi:hypothetical protein